MSTQMAKIAISEKQFPSDEKLKLPKPFVMRRLHSLMGLWLSLYLFEHLLVNSQAALFFLDDGHAFVHMVNKIHDLPFLKAIEIAFLGIPFLLHGVWGVKYALTAKGNAHKSDGTTPALPQYKRNRAYSLQRITSWILLVGIVAHVIHMRFLEYPSQAIYNGSTLYMTRLENTASLSSVAKKLHTTLLTSSELKERIQNHSMLPEELRFIEAAEKKPLKTGQVLAVAPSAGAVIFLIVREAFTHPLLVILYSILVVTAVYHGFNGLWTFLISWGFTLTHRSQKRIHSFTTLLMALVMFMGLFAAWGTYLTTVFGG